MIILKKKRKAISLIIFILSISGIMAFTAFVIDVGMILSVQFELQKAVETAALASASTLEPQSTGTKLFINADTAGSTATSTFNAVLNNNNILTGAILKPVEVNIPSKSVRITAEIDVPTYFIAIVGVKRIKILAKSAAVAAPFYLSPYFPINSFASGANTYNKGSLMTDDEGDTDIRKPVGDNFNENSLLSNLYDAHDNRSVSLGPGGYFSARLPIPVVNGDGADLFIKEVGNAEGYFIFVGVDVDPSNPYENAIVPGAGIKWRDISCSGVPVNTTIGGKIGPQTVTITVNSTTQTVTKFYGSGYFDIGASCAGSLSSAKYLRIVDDNNEDGFLATDLSKPVTLPGEHSSVTPGVDIDAVGVLHHSRLIRSSDYAKDSDADGLIDILENILGSTVSDSDTDNDTRLDGNEYLDWATGGSPILGNGTSTPYSSSMFYAETPAPDAANAVITGTLRYCTKNKPQCN